jgi:Na+-translocating ferredoxin:NAD+ oxidoreductase RNF subunit RnfB
MQSILTSILALGSITSALSIILVLVNKRLFVPEDPRIDQVEGMLPSTNCGACGFPGCRAFAEAVVKGDALPGKCTVSSEDERGSIADFLGVEVGAEEKLVARLACAGGSNVSRDRARYSGLSTCRAAALVGGGGKSCYWGCLGLGDCEEVCDFDAIHMNAFNLPVVDEDKCTACGDCVEVCPKGLFSLHPVSHRLWVACKNLEVGEGVLEECEVACTACGRCALDAPDGLIAMKGDLPVVNYELDHNTRNPIERCPTGAIVWLDRDGPAYGRETKKVLRKAPLPAAAT